MSKSDSFHSLSLVSDLSNISPRDTPASAQQNCSSIAVPDLSRQCSPKIIRQDVFPHSFSRSPTHPSFPFQPLPRLDEASSEESIQELSVQSGSLCNTLNVITDMNTSNTPSSSWSNSRRSDFASLSKCSSNSNHTPTTQPEFRHNDSPSSDTLVHTESSYRVNDNVTVHRLRANIPVTPAIPPEHTVAPPLGSDLSLISNLMGVSDYFLWNTTDDETKVHVPPPQQPVSMATPTTTTIDSSAIWDINEQSSTLKSSMIEQNGMHKSTWLNSPVEETHMGNVAEQVGSHFCSLFLDCNRLLLSLCTTELMFTSFQSGMVPTFVSGYFQIPRNYH